MTSTTAPESTRTNALTSIFTPPVSCSSHWTYEPSAANSLTGGLLLQNAQAGHGDEPCFPPGFGGWGRAPSFIQVFSPGACPTGYTTAINNYNGDVTTAVCCMSNFRYTNFISSVNAGGKTAQYFGCTSVFTDAGVTTVFAEEKKGAFTSSLDGTTTIFTSVSGLITMWAQPITVAFQSTDSSLFTTSQTSTSAEASSTTSSETSTTTSSSSTTSSFPKASSTSIASPINTQNSSPALSSGTIAGIVVGVLAFAAIAAGCALIFLRRHRKPAPPANQDIDMAQAIHFDQDKSTRYTDSDRAYRKPPYDTTGQTDPVEMQQPPAELPNQSRRHELP